MIKKISTLALAAMIALPSMASAGGADDISAQIERLTQELNKLKQEMAQLKETTTETVEDIEEKSAKWDLASRIQLSGDMRSTLGGISAESESAYQALNVAKGVNWFVDPNVLQHPTVDGITASGRYTTADNIHTIDIGGANAAAFNGTANVLYGFFLTDPTSPTFGVAANSAGAAGQTISNILYGNTTSVTVNPATGSVAIVGTPTLLSASQRTQNLVDLMKGFTPTQRAQLFAGMGYSPDASTDYENDTLWTNRFRLNMRVKATENMEFKGRLSMYKAWGMQNNPVDYTYNAGNGGGPFMLNSLSFDGSSSRQPTDNKLVVDRAFMNWNNIADQDLWFSIGRRPTTDGPPAQLRMGADQKMATPVNYMDYPFDGATIGMAYDSLFGLEDFPGRIRFCYGRGFESGPTENGDGIKDVDFAGINWDVYHSGNRFFNVQSFAAFDMFNVPDDVTFVNPLEYAFWNDDSTLYDPLDTAANNILDRVNLGNIYHTSAVYMNKVQDLNYFLVGGWSKTKAEGVDEMGTSLLGSWWDSPEDKDGYAFYAGVRYDIPNQPWKVGLEYNYGTKNWISFTPGNDDLYASKLATRGDVWELYTIWDIPSGEVVSKFGRAFVRLGAQHYNYEYTGSGFWLGKPEKIAELRNDPMAAQFYVPIDTMTRVYLSLEAWF